MLACFTAPLASVIENTKNSSLVIKNNKQIVNVGGERTPLTPAEGGAETEDL